MKRLRRIGMLIMAAAIGLGAILFMLSGVSAAAVEEYDQVDLNITVDAPDHVGPGMNYVVNVVYNNIGTAPSAQDTWVSVLLPEGVQFVAATDRSGEPMPPDSINENLLSWYVGSVPVSLGCQHILVTLAVADDLAEGTELVASAEIGSSTVEINTDNNNAIVTSLVCDMAGSTKQVHTQQVKPGDVLTYTIQLRLVQRPGSLKIQHRSVTLTDMLNFQNQVRFLGWAGPISGTWDGNTLRWQGDVRADEPLALRYRVGVQGDVVPGTILTNTAHLSWSGMQVHLGPATTVVTMPHNAQMIGPLGYVWQHENGVTITVPPNAVTETTRFEYRPVFTDTQALAGPPGYMFAHRSFELTAFRFNELHQFSQPITISLKLNMPEIAGLKRETLCLWYRSGPGEAWAMLGGGNWISPDTLEFTTSHFTQFALFGLKNNQVFLPFLAH